MSLRVRRVMKVTTDEKKGNTKCPQYIFKQFGASLTHFISIYFAKKSLGRLHECNSTYRPIRHISVVSRITRNDWIFPTTFRAGVNKLDSLIDIWCFNSTFSNISATVYHGDQF